MLGTRLRVNHDKIAEIEILWTTTGYWLFNADATCNIRPRRSGTPFPPTSATTRTTLVAAANAYLDAFLEGKMDLCRGACPAIARKAARTPAEASPTDCCEVGVPSGVNIANRRFVVDETIGSVVVFCTFGAGNAERRQRRARHSPVPRGERQAALRAHADASPAGEFPGRRSAKRPVVRGGSPLRDVRTDSSNSKLSTKENAMERITRRGFVTATSALAAAPALTALTARAQPPGAPVDIGNLRAEKDIVFGKGGSMDLTLDVYQPPTGVTPKRMAIIHLFGGGFFVGNKNAGYIINDAKALGARGYTNISANYRLQTQGPWPAQIHDVKGRDPMDSRERRSPRHRRQQDRRRRLLGRRHALADGGRHERQEGVRGRRRQRRASARTSMRASASIRWRVRRPREVSFPRARRRPRTSPRLRRRRTSAPRSRRRFSFTAPRTGRSRCSRASTSSPSSMASDVPSTLTLIQGADHAFDNNAPDAVEVMAASIDLFLDRLLVNPKPYPSFGGGGRRTTGRRTARWRRRARRSFGRRTGAASVSERAGTGSALRRACVARRNAAVHFVPSLPRRQGRGKQAAI